MTKAYFYQRKGVISAFKLYGHTDDEGNEEARIVCAAISSAAYMTANTITEILGLKADIDLTDSFMRIDVVEPEKAKVVLEGFKLHIQSLAEQYPNFIQITTEV